MPGRWSTAAATAARRACAQPARAFGLLLGLCLYGSGPACADDAARGFELYMDQCSKCHGLMGSLDTVATRPSRTRTLRHVALLEPDDYRSCSAQALAGHCRATPARLAFAMPFGPSLEGVLGRQAGTLPGYEYSKAFRAALSGTTWDESTIDEYISDSQLRAPGIRMFYRQPDAGIRRLIIEFLKTRR
ncbi:MAG: c-type cytochrome [Gammaproteobacteria bacterium]